MVGRHWINNAEHVDDASEILTNPSIGARIYGCMGGSRYYVNGKGELQISLMHTDSKAKLDKAESLGIAIFR